MKVSSELCCGGAVLPPLSFFLYEGSVGGFERGSSFANGVSRGAAVFGKCRPLKIADVASTEDLRVDSKEEAALLKV